MTGKAEILKFLGIGIGGLLVALQAFASHRRAKAMGAAAKAQSEAAKQHVVANRYTEQGQRQERLKNAIEHLGHSSVSVRLGGAYELFHLAQDTTPQRSPFDRLWQDTQKLLQFGSSRPLQKTHEIRQTVHEVLCAHIRETTTQDEYLEKYKSEPSTEIHSLLTLLFVEGHEVFRGLRAHLEGSCLKGAYLPEAHLRGAYLTEAELQFAVLRDARLQGAFLRSARLQGADLRGARLQGTILYGGFLQGASLRYAKLQGIYLGRAGLQGAILQGVQLQGVQPWAQDNKATPPTFNERIRQSIGRESDLSEVTFTGGLDQMESLFKGLSDEHAALLQGILTLEVDRPESCQLPLGSDAVTGAYTEEEAAQWIAEYEEDM